MAVEPRTTAHGGLATVLATAAVTLALGMTAASLAGYLRVDRGAEAQAKAAAPATTGDTEAPSTADTPAPAVVLVPVSPDAMRSATPASPASPDSETVVAAYSPTARSGIDSENEHHRARGRHVRENDDDDED